MEPCVQLGDQVIIYQSRDSIVSLIVRAGQQLQCKFGVFKHEAMVGVLFGSKVSRPSSPRCAGTDIERISWRRGMGGDSFTFFDRLRNFGQSISTLSDGTIAESVLSRTLALPHRTQILYQPDISFITSFLDVKPGSKVIEAGLSL